MATLDRFFINYSKETFDLLHSLAEKFNNSHESDIFDFILKILNLDDSRCLDCGEHIFYYDTVIKVSRIMKENQIRISFVGKTNALTKCNEYHLCICEKCLTKKFPEYKTLNKGRVFNRMNKYTQYAFKIPDDIYEKENHKLNARTLENFIAKYGEEGKKHWDKYVNKCSITNTFEYKHEKYGWTKEQFDEYNKSRAVTLKLMIARHGEEDGRKRYDEYCKKQQVTSPFGYSKKAYTFCNDLHEFLKNNKINVEGIQYFNKELNLHEKRIITYDNDVFYLDMFLPVYNIAIEFYGNYYHMNPEIFDKNSYNKTINMKGYEKIEYDKNRVEIILNEFNIATIIVWEKDYDENKQETFNKILNTIKARIEK